MDNETKIDELVIDITSDSSNAVTELDKLSKSLEGLKTASSKMTKAKNGLNKLSESLDKLKASSKGLTALDKLSSNLSTIGASTGNLSKGLTVASTGLTAFKTVAKSVLNVIGTALGLDYLEQQLSNCVENINDYVENINLFKVSMGEFYEEGKKYAETLESLMGIDSGEWMRNQGMFMSMAKGFGLVNEQAYEMSKGLTELAYDMSSLYNSDVEEAFLKLRSALAGEIEPLRSWGISLTEATLKQLALSKGITKNVEAMTEAEKAQLRYVAIVEAATKQGVIGDFARTLESPANALRVLKQQFVQLARSVGSVFIPILTQVLPYVQALTKVITGLIKALATLVGFKMPENNWNSATESINSGVSGVSDSLSGATSKAKELKKQLMGFDELNILSNPDKASSGGGASVSTGGDLGLDISSVWSDAMLSKVESQVNDIIGTLKALKTKWLDPIYKKTIKPLLDYLGEKHNKIIKPLAKSLGELAKNQLKVLTDATEKLYQKVVLPLFDFLGGVVSTVLEPIATFLIDNLAYAFENTIVIIECFWKNVMVPLGDFLVGQFSSALERTKQKWEEWQPTINKIMALVPSVELAFRGLVDFFTGVFTLDMQKAWKGITNIFVGFDNFLTGVFAFDWTNVFGNTLGEALNGFSRVVQSHWEMIKGVFSGVITFVTGTFSGNWKQAWSGVVQIFSSVVSGIANIFRTPLNWIIDGINSFILGLNKIKIPDWVPEVGGYGFNVSLIPRLEDGGFPPVGQMFIAREAGPELVGTIGGRSAVANNEQIIEGISQGVYEAMLRANTYGNSSVTVNATFEMDGDVVGKKVIKYHNGVVAQTGESPLFI